MIDGPDFEGKPYFGNRLHGEKVIFYPVIDAIWQGVWEIQQRCPAGLRGGQGSRERMVEIWRDLDFSGHMSVSRNDQDVMQSAVVMVRVAVKQVADSRKKIVG